MDKIYDTSFADPLASDFEKTKVENEFKRGLKRRRKPLDHACTILLLVYLFLPVMIPYLRNSSFTSWISGLWIVLAVCGISVHVLDRLTLKRFRERPHPI